MTRLFASILLLLLVCASANGADHFLTIGGGGSPHNNQLSLERNVVFFRRVLADCGLAAAPHEVYFACGAERRAIYNIPMPMPSRRAPMCCWRGCLTARG